MTTWLHRLRWRAAAAWVLIGALRVGDLASQTPLVIKSTSLLAIQSPAASGYVGNEACSKCHSAIVDSYRRTAMAGASGAARDAFTPAEFTHQPSGVHYRVYEEAGRAWLGFDRPGDSALQGRRELLYFIGSGHRGRTYLFETDGFLFESPVNWYAKKHTWDMAPAYQSVREMPLNLPAYASCLHCHVSDMQPPLKGTDNRYPEPPFAQNGVSCERCHGPGLVHINGGKIVNPAKLSPARRDDVCMQCHLEGKVAIERAGRHVYEYRPGDKLDDYVRYFLQTGPAANSLGAVSQEKALAQSKCKKKSGDAMSCTSCHDPHGSPAAEDRVAFYRGKCLACHADFADKHHSDQPDCTACHMPGNASSDVAHTEVTDHRIPRRIEVSPQLLSDFGSPEPRLELEAFPRRDQNESDAREIALAWASLVESGMTDAEGKADEQLTKAIKQSPSDPALLTLLGYLEQKRGKMERARTFYKEALAVEPDQVEAQTNLAVIEAKQGEVKQALKLWLSAFQRAPDRSGIGLNIARAYCAAGQKDDALAYVARVLQFNPDLAAAKHMLLSLKSTPPSCAP